MSRFRPGRRKDDHEYPGEAYDGDAYEGGGYDDEPYPDEPPGRYPPQDGHEAEPRAGGDGYHGEDGRHGAPRSGGPRPAGRSHQSRFRNKDEVLQPTSVISPGGLVGGPRPDQATDDPYGAGPGGDRGPYQAYGPVSYDAAAYGPGDSPYPGPAGAPGPYPAGPAYGPGAGYAYPPSYDPRLAYGPPGGHVPAAGHVPTHAPGYETGAAYPPGPDSEVESRRGTAAGLR